MSTPGSMHQPLATGGVRVRRSSRMRRLLGALFLFATWFAASLVRTAAAQPAPGTPADGLALLKWCWENRSVTNYRELFADNFQYYFDAGNPAGAAYQSTPWTRADELVSSSNLFLGGVTTHAPASSVALTFTDGPTLISGPGSPGYPWHQQLEAQWTLDITCTDGSTLHGSGTSKWFMVRGDSAAIPQDLKNAGFTADPGRWYIERWLEEPNTAPIVRAPSAVNGTPFFPLTVPVTAWDPDGDPIAVLSASVSGFSPKFTPSADNTSGTFSWTPYPTDIGVHGVTFMASNSLVGLASTTLNIVATNSPPIPNLRVTPPGGPVPLSVTADASASSDPDGHIVSYRFDFGDGTVMAPQPGPTATHTYTAIGSWPLTVSVTDDAGAAASVSSGVTVTATPVASVSVTPASANLKPGATQQLTATPRDSSGNAIAGLGITWSSSSTAVARVNSSGLVTGIAAGVATITATCSGKSGSSVMTVVAIPVATVLVSPATATIEPGATQQLSATPKDSGGNVLTGRAISWASDNAAATVGSSGLVTGVTPGSAHITATCEGKSGTSTITIFAAPVASILVSPAVVRIAPGSTQQLFATPQDASGNILPRRTVTWASDDTSVATVNPIGLVRGVAIGSANITATCEGKSGSSAITVGLVPVASVTVSAATAVVGVGATQQLTATPADANGNALSGRSIAWASDNTAAATVSSSGLVTGIAAGSANISATCEGKSGSSAITVAVVSVTPTDALVSLKSCWENRDLSHYHELFADNYQYFDVANPNGAPHTSIPWTRADELVSSSNLFLGGGTGHAPASSVTLAFTDGPTVLPNVAGLPAPWHQQLEAQWTLDITCTDGSTLHGNGKSKWFVVRGDSAVIPQELKNRGFTADPSRWYIERWLEEQNTAPMVGAPSVASGTPFSTITIHVTAQDPDGDPIAALGATVSGFTPAFSATADNTSGTFSWVPMPTDVGPHGVTFTAANSLIGSATTLLNVVGANRPPVPALVVTPSSGVGPLPVTADASGSSDPDGRVVSYKFDFGDGAAIGPQASPTATHTYAAVGAWPLTLTVTDDLGATASISARVSVTGAPVASVSVAPDTAIIASASTLQLTATPRDAGGNALTGRSISWASDNTTVATVNASGLVSGFTAGSARITATCEGKSGSSAITVVVIPVASVLVTPASAGVAAGSTRQLTATPKDAAGNALVGRSITWASDNTAAATVSSTGVVAGVAAGSANVTATCEGVSGSAAITVTGTADPVSLLPNLVSNPSFEVDLSGWVPFYGATIDRVPGGYDGSYALQMTGTAAVDFGFGVNDHPDWIRPTTAAGKRYRYSARVRSASSHGAARIRIREYLMSSAALLGQISSAPVTLSPTWQTMVVDYITLSAGSTLDLQVKDNPLVASEVFQTDDISIKDITALPGVPLVYGAPDPDDRPGVPSGGTLSFRATLYPSPVQSSAVLSFATTRPGPLRVDLIDLAGRQVRHLDNESDAPAGSHMLTIDRTQDDGHRISPGLYFYRIVADEGQLTGRFVILK